MTFRRALLAGFSTALLLGLAWGCSAADSKGEFPANSGGSNGIGEAGNDEQTLSPGGSSQTDDGGLVLNRLCGKEPSCVPDRFDACASYAPPVIPPSDDASLAPDVSLPSEAGAAGDQSVGGASAGLRAGESGATGESGASGAAGQTSSPAEGGSGGAAPGVVPKFGCQVQRVVGAPRAVVSECAVVGFGGANAPCLTSADCQAGFGCVGDQNSGLCQQYCCQSGDQCKQGTYCAERSMRDATTNALAKGASDPSSLLIPVCVPAENCDLSAPYPCTEGTQCACKASTACLVVRSDGTSTSTCAVPGTGKVGGACPCAWGHVCSAVTNQCLKLCYTRGAASCGTGQCQSASDLPDGWGVCVGGTLGGG